MKLNGSGKKTTPGFIIISAVIVVSAALSACYLMKSAYYRTHFQKNVYINGINVEGLGAEEAGALIAENIEDYKLKITERYLPPETISGEDIDLKVEYDKDVSDILKETNSYLWIFNRGEQRDFNAGKSVYFDREKLREKISELECLKEKNITRPANAYIRADDSGEGFVIVEEVRGNSLREGELFEAAEQAVEKLSPEINLEELELYEEPLIKAGDAELNKRLSKLNRYAKAEIVYDMGGGIKEVCGGDRIIGMTETGEDGEVLGLSEEKIAEYVKELVQRYDTAGTKRKFTTVYGSVVELSGPYGWETDVENEEKALKSDIEAGKKTERAPVNLKKAKGREPDWGDEYIEVDLTSQKLFFIKDGKEQFSADIISGQPDKGCETPSGIFEILEKKTDAKISESSGDDSAPKERTVNYWLEFSDGLGFYDASWRSAFGGNVYKVSGSGGCINLPYSKAKALYESVSEGMPVICYRTGDEALPESMETENAGEQDTDGESTPSQL